MNRSNKAALFLLTLFLIASPTLPATDAKTAQFLRKVNLYYYCPSREGLKGFTCDLTLSVSDIFKQSLVALGNSAKVLAALEGQKFKLTVTGDEFQLVPVPPAPTGDKAFDEGLLDQLKHMTNNFNAVFGTWVADVFVPGFDEKTLKERTCTVTRRADGFTVDQKSEDGSILKITFDKDAKRTQALGYTPDGKLALTMGLTFSRTPKGLLMDSYGGEAKSMDVTEKVTLTYGPVGDFILPLRIVKDLEIKGVLQKGSTMTVDLSNFTLTR